MSKLLRISFSLVAALCCAQVHGQEKIKVDLGAVTPKLQAAARKALDGVQPSIKGMTEGINKHGVYTMTGNVFGDGRARAVLDLKGTVVLCSWEKNRWEPSVYFRNVSAQWLSPTWREDFSERYAPVSKRPFRALRLQGRTLLAVASETGKNAQDYDVFLLDKACRRVLDETDSYGRPPDIIEGYLETEDGSRRKSIWSANYYSRIEGDKFVTKASWGEYVPYNESEDKPPYYYASRDGGGYVILWDEGDEKSREATNRSMPRSS